MKRNLLFAFVLSLMMTSCDWLGGGGTEIVPLPELTVTVSDDTVPSGGHYVTITVDTKFAVSTDNNKNMPHSTSWRDSIYITETTKLVISAYNIDGISVKSEKTIMVLPPVYVPTRTDTINSSPWNIISIDAQYLPDTTWVIASFDLSTKEQNALYYFHENGDYESVYNDVESLGGCRWYWAGKSSLQRGSSIYAYTMTNKRLTLYIPDPVYKSIIYRVRYYRN